jgi:hypothetical protein
MLEPWSRSVAMTVVAETLPSHRLSGCLALDLHTERLWPAGASLAGVIDVDRGRHRWPVWSSHRWRDLPRKRRGLNGTVRA